MNNTKAPSERSVPGLSARLQARLRLLFKVLGALSPALAARLALRLFITPVPRPVSAEESAFLATARLRALTTDHGRIQTYEWPATGPTLLIVHGWSSHTGRLRHAIAALHARGFRIVAFDGPGHGQSGGRYADLHALRDTISTVTGEFGAAQAILAHSYGALAVAVWLAHSRPAELRAAVLVGMPRDIGYILESFTLAMALRPRVIERLRARFYARYGAWPEFYEAGALAAQIPIPVLQVHGAADEFVPVAHARPIHERFALGELSIRPDLTHSAPLSDAASLATIAGFLQRHMAGSGP
ncbi:MAG: alpha/beta fold hydrolase [Steroidobacteraceae bacterium]